MRRDFAQLADGPHDLLVIGGGIYGAWVAHDAALRGLRVVLVDRLDWGSGTSQSSSKLIHGGLRYLQYGRLGLVRKSLLERRLLLRLAPHRVRPLRFVLPVYRGSRTGRFKLGIGLRIYDALANARNVGRHHRLSSDDIEADYPFLNNADLVGGFTYGDAQTDDARLTLEIVEGAAEAGAKVVNYAEATGFILDGKRVVGAYVTDRETTRKIEVRADVTVHCGGPWVPELLGDARRPMKAPVQLAKGVHLVMPGLPTDRGILVQGSQRGRVTFLLPWYGRTLLGTTDTEYTGDPGTARIAAEEIDELLEKANGVLMGTNWKRADIISGFVGVRTLPASRPGRKTSSISRGFSLRSPADGLLVPIGGKLTSARSDAVDVVNRVESLRGHSPRKSRTAERPFPWRPDRYRRWRVESISDAMDAGLDEEVARVAGQRYGNRLGRLLDTVRETPELAARIVPDLPFVWGEVPLAVTHEMAISLEDVVRRRIPVGLLVKDPDQTLRAVGQMMQQLLGWSNQRMAEELNHTRRKLAVLEV
ncbi:MAG: glycerol-3-phosphate dehydrogenase/oxidase [Acidobacteriota bacterium]|nr:glycerol-3-phosphate dehydrogenase/oxidase [Acidobacteriota bacterium]MDH3783922.1 glycerol-3-phosphate dehydrogenase/oxidase [Acidobacteriota bacterium]